MNRRPNQSVETATAALTQKIAELAVVNEELWRSRQRIVAVEESVRKEIAGRLHGSVQNRLLVLLMRLTQVQQAAPAGDLAVELESLVQEIGEPLERDLRSITYQLYPPILRLGLVPSVETLCDLFAGTLSVDMDLDKELVRQERKNHALIQDEVKLSAYRIVEQALGNALKHSKASQVVVRLELTADQQLRVAVRDNGCGFDAASTNYGLGISLIKDYAEVVGGEGVVHSTPGDGTEVVASVPLNGAEAQHPAKVVPSG